MRVVLSEKKNLAVNEELLNVLGDKDFTREFPYTAKVRIRFIYFLNGFLMSITKRSPVKLTMYFFSLSFS